MEIKLIFKNPLNDGKFRRPEGRRATFFGYSLCAAFRKFLLVQTKPQKKGIPSLVLQSPYPSSDL